MNRTVRSSLILVLVFIAVPAWTQTRDENAVRCSGTSGGDPDSQINACTALIQSGQEEAATRATAYMNRGNAYDDKGLFDQAIADYNEVILINPDYAAAYLNRGLAYNHRGFNDEAIADYRTALMIDPNYQKAKDGLQRLGVTP